MAGARAWHQLAGQRRASSSVGRGCGTSIQARNAQMLPSQAQALQSGGQSLRQRFASSSWTRQRFASSSWTRCWSSTKAVLPPHQHGGAAPHQHGGAAPHQHGGAAPHQHGGAPFAPRVNFPSCARYGRHQSIPLKQLELHPGAGASAYTHTHTHSSSSSSALLAPHGHRPVPLPSTQHADRHGGGALQRGSTTALHLPLSQLHCAHNCTHLHVLRDLQGLRACAMTLGHSLRMRPWQRMPIPLPTWTPNTHRHGLIRSPCRCQEYGSPPPASHRTSLAVGVPALTQLSTAVDGAPMHTLLHVCKDADVQVW